jgi:hypothetical protein
MFFFSFYKTKLNILYVSNQQQQERKNYYNCKLKEIVTYSMKYQKYLHIVA